MITSIAQLKRELQENGYSDDEINEFVKFVKPFFNFQQFMLSSKGKQPETVDEEISKYVQENLNTYMSEKVENDNTSQLKEYIEKMSKLTGEYAQKQGYEFYEKVENSMIIFLEFLLTKTFNEK